MQETSSSTASVLSGMRSRPTFALLAATTVIGCVVLTLAGYGEAVVMGVVQGLGEFLPISSSAHLILAPWLFGWQGSTLDSLTFDVALHLGTLIALLAYFWRDWLALSLSALSFVRRRYGAPGSSEQTQMERLLLSIVVGTIPAAVFGLLFEEQIEHNLREPLLIAVTLSVVGVLLYLADRLCSQRKDSEHVSLRDALLIGFAQACALIPGVSRSGATITMGRFLGFDRASAARYSFLLSAPITTAAVLVKLDDMLTIKPDEIGLFVVGVVVSGAVGALAIHFLLSYIRQVGFGVFAAYRMVLALTILLVYLMRS